MCGSSRVLWIMGTKNHVSCSDCGHYGPAADPEVETMTEKCPSCKKVMPPADPVAIIRFCLYTYSWGKDAEGHPIVVDEQMGVVCGKACLVELMEERAKKLPAKTEYRVGVVLNTDNPKEVLESFARQLRGIR
jgi:hypothetical protein